MQNAIYFVYLIYKAIRYFEINKGMLMHFLYIKNIALIYFLVTNGLKTRTKFEFQ